MRCTQLVGLPKSAFDYMGEAWKSGKVYDAVTGRQAGMFDDGPDLEEYLLPNGEVFREEVQCTPWSSGPMIFLRLVQVGGDKKFEWSQEDIDRA